MIGSGFKYKEGDEVYVINNITDREVTTKGIISNKEIFNFNDEPGYFYSLEVEIMQFYSEELIILKSEYRDKRLSEILSKR